MELSEAWAPEVHIVEVEEDGIVLDRAYKVKFDQSEIEKFHTLYYLKSRDVFVTVENEYKGLQVISDSDRIRSFREQYLGQQGTVSSNDFTEFDDTEHTMYKSEVDITNLNSVRQHGRLLETRDDCEFYYLESMDVFATIVANKAPAALFQSNEVRRKFKIPYLDERFENMNFK